MIAPDLTWRQRQLAHYGAAIRWLPNSEAREMYAYVLRFDNDERYGLNPGHVNAIERVVARGNEAGATAWLRERLASSETVYVVYGDDEVAAVSAGLVVDEWSNLFAPSRDDAILMAESGRWVAFYCHEDEWEWGRPLDPTAVSTAIKSISL